MLRAGAPLTEIGQVLRHSQLASTAIYAKADIQALRALARPCQAVPHEPAAPGAGRLPRGPAVPRLRAGPAGEAAGPVHHLPGRCRGGDRDHPARAGVGDAARREPKLARAAAPSSPRVRLLAAHHRPSSRGAAGRPPPMEALPGHQMRQPNSPAWPSTWHGDLRDPHGSTWVYLRRAAPPGVECGRLERRTRPGEDR